RAARARGDWIRAMGLPGEWQGERAAPAAARGLKFLSTPFDHRAVDELAALGVPAYKIASFEIVDLPLIGYAASKGRPMVLSTGLASDEDIADAVAACAAPGNPDGLPRPCPPLSPTPTAR